MFNMVCVRSSQPVYWLSELVILITSVEVPNFKTLYVSCVLPCSHGLVSCVVTLDLSYGWIQTKDGRLTFSLTACTKPYLVRMRLVTTATVNRKIFVLKIFVG